MYPVELYGICKKYKKAENNNEDLIILNNLDLKLENGTSTAIIGKSGSGKSTLLQISGLLDKPTSGKVIIAGKDSNLFSDKELSEMRNRYIGFIFQSNLLLTDFNALENVMIPNLIFSKDMKKAEKKAEELLASVGLSERMKHMPSQLSGGEKQRVAICRALINDPMVIMADEPTGSLDETNASEIEKLLLDICRERGKSLLLVTHNTDFADKCNIVYKLEGGMLTSK